MMLQREQYVHWHSISDMRALHSTFWRLRCVCICRHCLSVCLLFTVRAASGLFVYKFERNRVSQGTCSAPIDHAGADRHTQAHTCTHKKGRAEDQWSVKWFCYHVAWVEYIFPSTLMASMPDGLLVRCVWAHLCVCVCLCVYFVALSPSAYCWEGGGTGSP